MIIIKLTLNLELFLTDVNSIYLTSKKSLACAASYIVKNNIAKASPPKKFNSGCTHRRFTYRLKGSLAIRWTDKSFEIYRRRKPQDLELVERFESNR